MRILVTGATGFIGRAVCARLAAEGHACVALTRDPESARRRVPALAAAYPWNAIVEIPPAAAFERVDAVVNLLGESIGGRPTVARKRAVRESRLLGTAHLVDALQALEAKPTLLISASAVGYYGDRGDEILDEDSAPGTGPFAQLCSQWEQAARRAADARMRVAWLRIAPVLDPSGGVLARMLPLFRWGLGGRLGSGRQWWAWITRDDLVSLIAFLLERPVSGAVLATSPQPVRQADFAHALGLALGRPAALPVPAFTLRALYGQFASQILGSTRTHPRVAPALGFRFRHPTLNEAFAMLGSHGARTGGK